MITAAPATNLRPSERAEESTEAKTVAAIATKPRRTVMRIVLLESKRVREVGRLGEIISSRLLVRSEHNCLGRRRPFVRTRRWSKPLGLTCLLDYKTSEEG